MKHNRKNIGRWLEQMDYKYVLPAIGYLPLPLGLAAANIRGLFNYCLDYEWRSQAVGFPYIRKNTGQAMRLLKPGKKSLTYSLLTAFRFMHNSREEWQARLFARPVMEKIKARSVIHGFDRLMEVQKSGRGLVMVSCHLDSFCMGMVLLGMNGLTINCVNTKAGVEDPRIHPMVTRFLKTKYTNMERLMSGRMEYHETNMDYFYKALKRAEAVALMGDVPGSKSTVFLDFAGKRIQLPLGAWHMAVRTDSLLSGYVCLMTKPGRYEVRILTPFEPDPQSPEGSMKPVYAFLEEQIRAKPARWIAADLTAAYHDSPG